MIQKPLIIDIKPSYSNFSNETLNIISLNLMNVRLIAFPFVCKQRTTILEKNETSSTGANKIVTLHGANISATVPLLVVYPEGSQIPPLGFNTDAEGKLQVEVLFNKPVNTSTFIPGISKIVAMETNPNATVTMKWDLNNRFLTMVTTDSLNSVILILIVILL
ncbi:MAG TPA: hypothetical protein VFR61_06360 [Nitrososphaeraceae archaeon]|nr:hypothetical protein [Nitrososphaeraceae archaeon]